MTIFVRAGLHELARLLIEPHGTGDPEYVEVNGLLVRAGETVDYGGGLLARVEVPKVDASEVLEPANRHERRAAKARSRRRK
jgi:hypothetical protein